MNFPMSLRQCGVEHHIDEGEGEQKLGEQSWTDLWSDWSYVNSSPENFTANAALAAAASCATM